MVCGSCNNYNDDNAEQCAYCGMPLQPQLQKKKNRTKQIAILSGIAVAIICFVLGIIFVNRQIAHKKYEEKVKSADRYLAELDYDSAIRAYNEAMKIDDKNEEIYIKLANVYQLTGNMERLDYILTLGYQRTESARIKGMINHLVNYGYVDDFGYVQSQINSDADETKATLASNEEKKEPTLNDAFFDDVMNKGYNEYKSQYGKETIVFESGSDVVSIVYSDMQAKLWYINGKEKLVDTSTGIPVGNIVPSYITVSTISVIMNDVPDKVSYEQICTLFNETPKIQKDNTMQYLFVHYRGCSVYLECDATGAVEKTCWIKIVVPNAGKDKDTATNTGIAAGKIMDASSGQGLDAVKLTFRQGADNQYGTEQGIIETDDGGNYTIELVEDLYTVCAEKDGYKTEYFEITIQKGQTLTEQNLSMSSELGSGEARIVLEWGSEPADLDAHIFGETEMGAFHVYFANMEFDDLVTLDVDDRSAYGPETITIKDISQGTFTYGVEDYSNVQLGDYNEMLGLSGATVKVYLANEEQPRVYTVPDEMGIYWEVFRIENGKIVDINQMRGFE